jgi:glycosyltransferase involved in cell wall biosynthesis
MIVKAPISVCIIVKNEPLLEKCILSFRDYIEELVIVDTGSTDLQTVEIARKYADKFEIYTACNNPQTGLIEDFSQAREYSFSLATKQHVMWLDSDDIIVGAENLLELTSAKATDPNAEAIAFMFPYEYSYNELGQCTCLHYRERLVSDKTKFHWVNPVHEVLIPNNDAKTVFVTNENVVYKHMRQYSDKPLESGRNLRILRNYFEKVKDTDARQMYYLGLECHNNGLVDEAIEHLSKYVDVSGWDDERAMACLKLIDIYMALGEYDKGLKWAFKTVALKETWGEGYFALGKMFYFLAMKGGPDETRHWERCAYFSNLGLSLPITKTLLFINPLDRNYDIHRYLNMALNRLGDVVGALNSVNTALKTKPDDQDLIVNKKIYETWLVKNQVLKAIQDLKTLQDIDQQTADLLFAIINKQINISAINQISAASAPVDDQKKKLDHLRLL